MVFGGPEPFALPRCFSAMMRMIVLCCMMNVLVMVLVGGCA